MENLVYQSFSNINVNDEFFTTLKNDYQEFDFWFDKKMTADEEAYVLYGSEGSIEGFMYLKTEQGIVNDVSPPLKDGLHLKIGTFKFESAGTRRGERFLKKVFDHAIESGVNDIYVTVFSKHEYLRNLFDRYGFVEHGLKETDNGVEIVLVRNLDIDSSDVLLNYPRFNIQSCNKYLVSIYPDFHTRMLPDSILNNESHDLIKDVSHSNSIHKIYLCNMEGVTNFSRGDILVTYRTRDGQGPAKYRSVITSVCVVEDYRHIDEFPTLRSFLNYTGSYSVFSMKELNYYYSSKKYPYIFRFTYNVAFKNRVIRDKLINEVGLDEQSYWGVMQLTDSQFSQMLALGGINEHLVID